MSWFKGLNFHRLHYVLTAAAAVAGIFTVLGVLASLGVIGPTKPVPKLYDVSKSGVSSGDQVTIPGERLDLVSQVYLASDLNDPILLTFAFVPQASHLLVTIPKSLAPGKYNLLVKTKAGETRATQLWLNALSGSDSIRLVSIPTTPLLTSSPPQQVTPGPNTPTPTEAPVPPPADTSTPTPIAPTSTPRPTPPPRPTATATLVPTPTPWVGSDRGTYIRFITNQQVYPGEIITVEWQVVGTLFTTADSLGLYPLGAPATGYVGELRRTGGKPSATMNFKAPPDPGNYEVRYLFQGTVEMAVSQVVDVVLP